MTMSNERENLNLSSISKSAIGEMDVGSCSLLGEECQTENIPLINDHAESTSDLIDESKDFHGNSDTVTMPMEILQTGTLDAERYEKFLTLVCYQHLTCSVSNRSTYSNFLERSATRSITSCSSCMGCVELFRSHSSYTGLGNTRLWI